MLWWQRLHQALMPDYNRGATLYWWTVVCAGALALGYAAVALAAQPSTVVLQVMLGTAIAMIAGIFPVRISKNSFAAGEVFIFLLLLIHGPAAAIVAAAGEAAVGSMRTSKRMTSRIASPAMAAVAMIVAAHGFDFVNRQLVAVEMAGPGMLLVAAMGFALAYFIVTTLLVTAVPRLKQGQGLKWHDLFGLFGWVAIAYAGSATLAVLLYLTYLQSGFGVLAAMLPLLASMLAALHYFFRQQEAAESARAASAEASAREQELAARHVCELEASERRFHNAFTHASIGMALTSDDGSILQVNPALRELLGRDVDELLHQRFQDHVRDEDRAAIDQQLARVSSASFDDFSLELRCRHRNGNSVWVSLHGSLFSEPGATKPCLILQVQDITARRKAEQGLHHIAFHDALTGLPNRRRFHELLGEAVNRAAANPRDAFAVMFIDFDRFKLINDSLGHDAGDEFLVLVSRRIQHALREHDIVARLGGDEFAILARPLHHERYAVQLAERLMEALRKPFHVAGQELMTSASIGITFSALGYDNPERVLRDADIAMYKAKGAGKARYALFDASLHTEVAERLQLEGELRRAIDDGLLSVVYQPLFDIGAAPGEESFAPVAPRINGFEALVRWNHPERGAISPGAFLPIAEEAGMMLKLTDFVLHCACRQLRQWELAHPAHGELTISVNISGHDLAHGAFLARVTRAIVESGLHARQLCLELTENILASRVEDARPLLEELRRLGVVLAIDDFGTGYSSLSHLATLPIDTLKIDQSFVARLGNGDNEAAVVRSIVLLGSSLRKQVVAEGIETETQLAQLRDMGCRTGQGFHLGRPMPAAEAASLLERRADREFAASPVTVAPTISGMLH
jgi:diguanylate cyclase (GGDEF)-like protein/PAS domain S-box-containing protein